MSANVWYHKYRPKNLDDYIFKDENLKEKVEQWIADPSSMQHLVLYGPPGTGKSSLARLLVSEMGLAEEDYVEYNAAMDNGVNMVRELQESFLQYGGWSNLRIVVLDEAHRLSPSAQSALLHMMEANIDSVRFIMTTNHPEKMDFAVNSRAVFKALDTLSQDEFLNRISEIMFEEMPDCNDQDGEILAEIFEETYPDMRKCINTMQDCMVKGHFVPISEALDVGLSSGDFTAVPDLIRSGNFNQIREFISDLPDDRIEEMYVYLYRNGTELFGNLDAEAAKVIGQHLVNHQTVSYPDLNLAACFAYLITLE